VVAMAAVVRVSMVTGGVLAAPLGVAAARVVVVGACVVDSVR